MELQNKGVFLTGGAKGIGRAIMSALLAKCARVFFCDINDDVGRRTESDFQKQYNVDHVIFQRCDVADAEQLEATFQMAVTKLGAVDICVNNAGILDERIWERVTAINMMGTIRSCKLAMEHMRLDKGGRGVVIINTVSMAGLRPFCYSPVYAATKHALIGFTQSWAMHPDTAKMGIRWGCVCPGPVNTDLSVFEDGQVFYREINEKLATKNMLEPEQVGECFMKLVQDKDSNGALIVATSERRGVYRKKQLVDADGTNNPEMADTKLSLPPDLE